LLSPRFFAIDGAEREAELIAGFPFKARSTVIPTASRFATDGKTYSAGRLFIQLLLLDLLSQELPQKRRQQRLQAQLLSAREMLEPSD